MDPDAALNLLTDSILVFEQASEEGDIGKQLLAAQDVIDTFEELDYWLAGGGFRPKRWAVA